jgi:hypothetical protein
LKRLLVPLLKIGISAAILAYLGIQAYRNDVFQVLASRPKHWGLLTASAGVCFIAVLLTFLRWYWLVRALDLPLRFRDALRMSFLSYLFNLAPMGIVGGDLFKAVMLARHQRGHRAKSLASVVVDRAIGLYVLFLVASAAILATGLWRVPVVEVHVACQAAFVLTAAGTVAVVIPLLPDVTEGKLVARVGRLARIGPKLVTLIEAVRMYRWRLATLAASAAITVAVHTLFALGIYLIAVGLYDDVHPLGTQLVFVPLSAATGVLPISLGPFEGVLDLLYAKMPLPDHGQMVAGQGLVVALGYRMITLVIAAVGLAYYLGSRREVAEVLHSAEVRDDSPAAAPADRDRSPLVEP